MRWHEIGFVLATGFVHLLASHVLDRQGIFIVLALVAWLSYAVAQARRDRRALVRWGFSRRGLRQTGIAAAVVGVVATGAMAWIAAQHGRLEFNAHLLPLLALYPIWGIVQQFLVLALVAGNLHRARGWLGAHAFVVPCSAVLFGLVHVPDWRLVAATMGLGLCFTPIYLRWRNLIPLGVAHGWLGALCYFWVLGRDPWVEAFG